jgi:serine protease DegQ
VKRPALYSRRPDRGTMLQPAAVDAAPVASPGPAPGLAPDSVRLDTPIAAAAAEPGALPRRRRWRLGREQGLQLAVAALGLAVLALGWQVLYAPAQRLTQDDIDAAVKHTLQTATLPSVAAKAAAKIHPSVVHVRGILAEDQVARAKDSDKESGKGSGKDADKDGDKTPSSGGTGVVILDRGVILTNLHVVSGAKSIKVTFADGTESDADVISTQPENDLAVLQARKLPDDLVAATMRSTGDLAPGDTVVAVGFPFGIGPSVSSGVVSGLKREFRSPDGRKTLTNLIQFDAAANPGNSGGPLVTAEGEVVGIVTAILNPSEQRTFIGIGFAVPIENAAGAVGLPPF